MTPVRMAVSAAERSVMARARGRDCTALEGAFNDADAAILRWRTDCQPRARTDPSRHCAASSKMQEVEIKPIAPVEPGEVH